MGSFKVKLVAYFLLLSLLPLAAAFWGFSTVAQRSETRRVDARLQAGLRATLAAYQEAAASADASAGQLARTRAFQRALFQRDRGALARMLRGRPNLTVEAPGGFRVGKPSRLAVTRRVDVVGAVGGVRGTVVAALPLDASLVRRLEARSGLEQDDHVILLEGGRIVAGPAQARGRFNLPLGRTHTVSFAGTKYRALVAGTLGDKPATTLGVITPQAVIDAANKAATNRLLIGLVAALVFVACVAYVEGRAIVRTIRRLVDAARAIARGDLQERVPVQGRDEFALLGRTFNQMAFQLQTRLDELEAERGRLRDVISRFGEALGATHDSEQLMRLIVEAAMEATGATGGVLVGMSGELVKSGYPDKGIARIEVPLQAGHLNFGSLMLFGDDFSDEDRMTAVSLASHAVVALDNARLHRIVERQALMDGLTGLANRRQCEESLADELARVERFGGSLAVVVADLDWFKDVNDRYGHPAGDSLLRDFALLLQETLRDVDLAGRWGGEEFLLILPGTDLSGGAQVAERVRAALASRIVLTVEGTPIPVTASFGVAAVPPAKTASELFATADAALYEAKRAGKNRVQTAAEPVASA
ncbi:MAG: diguanylate cyclase [Actinobacteria bacterium]|nr:MAG: diguanylate cyclase [Actinomycetota bacterium]